MAMLHLQTYLLSASTILIALHLGNSAEFLELFQSFLTTFWDGAKTGKALLGTLAVALT